MLELDTYPVKYLPPRLTARDRRRQRTMLQKSRKMYKKGVYYTRKPVSSYPHAQSKHMKRALKLYAGVSRIVPSNELAQKTGCSVSALEAIVRKGEGAYYSSGSRPNQTAQSWGYARLASAITGGKSAAVDWHILKNGCKRSGKAYRLGIRAVSRANLTRKVPHTK